MKLVLPVLLFLAFCLGGAYYELVYPPVVLKRATGKSLREFAETVATHDRVKISEALQALLAEDAQVRLAVTFFSVTQPDNPAVVQDFTKQAFIPFIDNILYTLTDYFYEPFLGEFKLAEDGKSADVTWTSREWADGVNYYGGNAVNMRFSSDTMCAGKVVFTDRPHVILADCKYNLRSVPKPDEMEKLRNPEALQQLLRDQQR
jgi:hypothetical protein